jgi:hypothetical protein
MLVAFDSDVANAVFRIATSAIFGAVQSLAAEDGVLGTPAGVLHLQRFSDGGMLNVHGHFVVSDGVFAEVPTSGRSHESDPVPPKDPDGPALGNLQIRRRHPLCGRRPAIATFAEPNAIQLVAGALKSFGFERHYRVRPLASPPGAERAASEDKKSQA